MRYCLILRLKYFIICNRRYEIFAIQWQYNMPLYANGGIYMQEKIVLYHGSPNKTITPTFGLGEDKHDYGKGFYLTEQLELAKEWAVCNPSNVSGWVHEFELDLTGLSVFDFSNHNILCWLAELMKHRAADDSKRYRVLSEKFINKYGVDTSKYDVIRGWRANASYFYIAKSFVRDEIDIEILEELLSLGGLGKQYCIKSETAYSKLVSTDRIQPVDYTEFNEKYNTRDQYARENMKKLINSDKNKVTNVFSTLI